MSGLKSEFLKTLQERGYINQCTNLDGLDSFAAAWPITAYVGFDCTADSLHVGNLVSLMMLRILQKCGGNPIALLGTGTTKVGDPSDKNHTRPMLTDDEINKNADGIVWAFDKILGPPDDDIANYRTKILRNGAWLNDINYLEFMRTVGRHFTINRMVGMDFVRNRLENQNPLTLLEFNYIILQAYDFVQLQHSHKCVLQMGGSDQWGNIVNGVELARRMFGIDLFGLTTNLITTSSGTKMGKTENGAVWLNPNKTSPYDYFQFWRNTEDADVIRFMKLFTDIDMEYIDATRTGISVGHVNINEAKEILAYNATKILHGVDDATAALATSRAVFYGSGSADGLRTISMQHGMTVVEGVVALGFAETKSEARRLIAQNGVKVNDILVTSDTVLEWPSVKISVGKKKHGFVKG